MDVAGLIELKNSLYRPGYLKQVNRYCPKITLSDLLPYPAGVRAQAIRDVPDRSAGGQFRGGFACPL